MENEKLITLEKVIKRDDYKRLSENLKERVEELASLICQKAIDLDLENISGYQVRKYKSNLAEEFKLTIYSREEGYRSLQDINKEYYLHGDYNCFLTGANNAEALEFLNSVKKILTELNQLETEKVNEIQKALDNTSNI